MEWKTTAKIVDSVLPGETVLMEYTTSYIPEFLLRFFVDYTTEKNIPLVIDDDFDALYTILTNARRIGLTIDLDRDNVYVLKTGGKFEVGNVVVTIPFHPDSRVYLANYAEASSKALQEIQSPAINLVLGLEELFLSVNNPLDAYQMVIRMQKFIGNKKRKAFYVVNEEAMKNLPIKVLGELERISTTVVRLTSSSAGANLKVLKSVNPRLVGMETVIDVGRWG
ncbi:MAG: DUF257 family protein [Thermococcus sp.]|nr:DUF257 family protein [Thermococcus sp.]